MSEPRLIGADELRERLDDPSLALVEVSFSDDDSDYRAGHLPGARWAHWKALLWDANRREFAAPEVLAARLGALGVATDQTLVLYGDPVQFGTYALWVLTAGGQRGIRVLDGGKEHWRLVGGPLTTVCPEPQDAGARAWGTPDASTIVGRDVVLRALEEGTHQIVDFRSPEEYGGERVSPYGMDGAVDHGAERKGRIPTAHHVHYRDLLHEDWTLRPREEILGVLAAAGVDPAAPIIGYCRLSHRATLGWIALTEVVGAPAVQVYDGSWTEWGSIVGVPIER